MKNGIGTFTISVKEGSNVYNAGTVTRSFHFKPYLKYALDINKQVEVQGDTISNDDYFAAIYVLNYENMPDAAKFKTLVNISIDDTNKTLTLTPKDTSFYASTESLVLTIFTNYLPVPESYFQFSTTATEATVTSFANPSADLSAYNTLEIPSTYGGLPVTKIGVRAFNVSATAGAVKTGLAYNSLKPGGNIKYLKLPNTLITLDEGAIGGTAFSGILYMSNALQNIVTNALVDCGFSGLRINAVFEQVSAPTNFGFCRE
jgi:hypothetical protein